MKPKVLVVYQHLPHYRRAVFQQLQSSRLFEFEFASSTTPLDPSIAIMDSSELRNFHELRNVQIGPFLWQRELLRLVGGGGYDAIIFLGDYRYFTTWLAAAIARVKGIKVLMWTQGWTQAETGLRRWIRLRFYSLAQMLLVYGHRAKELGIEMGYPGDKVAVVYNSLSLLPANRPEKMESPRRKDSIVLICVGRLTMRKRLEMLLAAAQILQDEGLRVSVHIIGDGEARMNLEKLASQMTAETHFHGALYEKSEINALISKADLFVIPGDAGLSVIQSLACGVPVITHDDHGRHGPEIESIVAGVSGDFFKAGELDSLVDKVRKWSQRSPGDRMHMRQVAIDTVRSRYSAEGHATRIETAIGKIVSPPPVASGRQSD